MKAMRNMTICLGVVVLLGGCAHEKEVLFFGTHTAAGVDVSGTVGVPDSAAFGYRRREVAIVPTDKNGVVHSVLGGADMDLGLGEARIKQIFATGDAARAATGAPAAPAAAAAAGNCGEGGKAGKPILFTTEANFSLLQVQASSGALSPKVSLGYSRSEATLIPLHTESGQAASVYADISIETEDAAKTKDKITSYVESQVGQHPSSFGTGVRVVQRFATGDAAVCLVRNNTNQAKTRLLNAVSNGTVEGLQVAGAEATLEKGLATAFAGLPDDASRQTLVQWAEAQFPEQLILAESCAAKTGADLTFCFGRVLVPKLTLDQKTALAARLQPKP